MQFEARAAVHRPSRYHRGPTARRRLAGWRTVGRWNTWREPEDGTRTGGGSLRKLRARPAPHQGPGAQLALGPVLCDTIAACPPARSSSGRCPEPARSARRPRRSRRQVDDRRDDPAGRLRRRSRRCARAAGRTTGSAAARRARGFGPRAQPPLARVLRPAHRPADRRRDVAGAGGLRRPRGRREQLVVAPAGGVRAAGLRPDRPQHERQPHERGQRAAGKRAKLGFAITTGDLADNQQLNETRWFKAVLDGGQVDPFCGKPISATNPCPGASADDRRGAQRRRRHRALHRRRRLRRLPAASRPTATAASGTRTSARRRPVRRLPALPGPAGARPERVHRGGPEGAVVHRPRQPRRADPGQRAREHRPLPRDRHGLPEGLPVGGAGPGAVRGRRRERGLPPDRRPVVHRRRCWPAGAASRRTRTAGSSRTDEYKHEIGGVARLPPRRRGREPARPTASPPTTRSARARASS